MAIQPLIVSVEMGYGHMRAAVPLAEVLGTEVLLADVPPLATSWEQQRWQGVRSWYEGTTRWSQLPLVGAPLRRLVDAVTAIEPLHPRRDQSRPHRSNKLLEHLIDIGFGRSLADYLEERQATLLTTFFVPAIMADKLGDVPVFCVVTDTDLHRIWVPSDPRASRIHYLAPSERAFRRLRAYGVPAQRISVTGFPLPPSLLGDRQLSAARTALRRRLMRLDPARRFTRSLGEEIEAFLGPLAEDERGKPPHLVYAVGGAGAQAELAERFLRSLGNPLRRGRLRLTLVAGRRRDVAAVLGDAIDRTGLSDLSPECLHVLVEDNLASYFRRFEALLADTDVLWTKPSELTFYGALGLPLIFSWPVGVHERYNRRWALEMGAGVKQREPAYAWDWMRELLDDGTLAAAAWSGFMRMPKHGLFRIAELVAGTGA